MFYKRLINKINSQELQKNAQTKVTFKVHVKILFTHTANDDNRFPVELNGERADSTNHITLVRAYTVILYFPNGGNNQQNSFKFLITNNQWILLYTL